MVHCRHGFLRRLVLDFEQLHLLSGHTPAVPDILRLSGQDQLNRYFLHGSGDHSADFGW